MKIILSIILVMFVSLNSSAQTFVAEENDTTVITEYFKGYLWAYRKVGNFVVGMTNYKISDSYGKYYQVALFIHNIGDSVVTFDPDRINAKVYKKSYDYILYPYTYDEYMKKIKRSQTWAMALLGFSSGLNAGLSSYQTTYTTTYGVGHMPYTQVQTTYNPSMAATANMASTTQMMTLSVMLDNEKKQLTQDYLRITTIHPGETIIGYMNFKYKKGKDMTVYVPLDNKVYKFDWMLAPPQKNQSKKLHLNSLK